MKLLNAGTLMALIAALSVVTSCATSDVGITAKVNAKLATNDVVKASQIEVASKNGIVTLTGNVDSPEAKSIALELARNTEGVTRVIDMIAARRPSGSGDAPDSDRTLGQAIDDAGITLGVKTLLIDDPLVKGTRIDVDTREGVVYLTGSVGSAAERDKAIELARGAKGVQDVQANLTFHKT